MENASEAIKALDGQVQSVNAVVCDIDDVAAFRQALAKVVGKAYSSSITNTLICVYPPSEQCRRLQFGHGHVDLSHETQLSSALRTLPQRLFD